MCVLMQSLIKENNEWIIHRGICVCELCVTLLHALEQALKTGSESLFEKKPNPVQIVQNSEMLPFVSQGWCKQFHELEMNRYTL